MIEEITDVVYALLFHKVWLDFLLFCGKTVYLSFLVSASESVFFMFSSSRAEVWVCCSSLDWSLFSSSACPSDFAEEQKDTQVKNWENLIIIL